MKYEKVTAEIEKAHTEQHGPAPGSRTPGAQSPYCKAPRHSAEYKHTGRDIPPTNDGKKKLTP